MTAVVLAVLAGWLVLSALATVAFALVARGGAREDAMRALTEAVRWAEPGTGQDGPAPVPHTAVADLPLR
jgi:hypothetical protein